MATLTVSHYIYLTKEQRYDIHNGKEVSVIGTSVPVWFQKGTTSEPAQEVFCEYTLNNKDERKFIEAKNGAYFVSFKDSKKILDVEDGGSEYMELKQYDVIKVFGRDFSVVHFIEIKPLEVLLETLS